jgi:hypothetical protein
MWARQDSGDATSIGLLVEDWLVRRFHETDLLLRIPLILISHSSRS